MYVFVHASEYNTSFMYAIYKQIALLGIIDTSAPLHVDRLANFYI